jgi:hypothetical protein
MLRTVLLAVLAIAVVAWLVLVLLPWAMNALRLPIP